MPTLVESDIESDSVCDSLPDQDLVIEAGGGDHVVKDLWSDNSIQQMDEPASLPKPLVKPPEEGIPTPQRDEEDKYGRMPG